MTTASSSRPPTGRRTAGLDGATALQNDTSVCLHRGLLVVDFEGRREEDFQRINAQIEQQTARLAQQAEQV